MYCKQPVTVKHSEHLVRLKTAGQLEICSQLVICSQ